MCLWLQQKHINYSTMDDLPLGYRFYPTEEELVSFYLRNKLQSNPPDLRRVIPDVDIYNIEPWHLPRLAGELCRRDTEQWFFFTPRQEQEARGGRPSRSTSSGYWKATGSPGYVYSSENRVIGVKKTMVFYRGKAPAGRKTKWKMNEYKAIDGGTESASSVVPKLRHEFSLCRVYVISGSFRAFDRRPLESVNRETLFPGDAAAASARVVPAGTELAVPAAAERSNSREMVDGVRAPEWEWEDFGPDLE